MEWGGGGVARSDVLILTYAHMHRGIEREKCDQIGRRLLNVLCYNFPLAKVAKYLAIF